MAEHGFTPGPWAVDPQYLSEVQTADDKTIASCWHEWADDQEIRVTGVLCCSLEESAANARLIAASPTLLEALEELLKDVDDLMGSSEGVAGLHHNGDLAPWSELAEGGQFSDWIGHATAKARAAITLATGKDA